MKRIVNAGGQAFVSLDPYESNYFKERGLAFTGTVDGNRTVVMAQEVVEAFPILDSTSLQTAIRRNTEWLQISRGLLYYYGYISRTEMIQMVERYSGKHVDAYEYLKVLFDAIKYGYDIKVHTDGFSHGDVAEVNKVIREHASRPDLPFYPFTKAQLLRAGKPEFVDKNRAFRAFVDFLRRSYDVDIPEAEEEAEFCIYEIQNNESIAHIVEDLTQEFETPSMAVLQDLTGHVAQLHNNTRQWFLKGHTPNELLPADRAALHPLPDSDRASGGKVVSMPANKKVGRNEPCPCGSGKKYKKCCGR